MTDSAFNVLFLCIGNSARSIFAEAILSKIGTGQFVAYSAGSHPKGNVNPLALKRLKAWAARPRACIRRAGKNSPTQRPVFDFVFTVCDDAADEACPVWPGQPMTAHWSTRTRRRLMEGH